MRTHARAALATLSAVAAMAATAQEITLYQGERFNGPRYTASSSVPDLARVGFNDRASSATIRGGSWQLCTDSYFRGQCITLNAGDYPSLSTVGLNNQVSSVREIGWSGGGSGGGGPGSGGGGWGGGGGGGGGSIILFEGPGQSGRSYTLNGPTADLGGTGFNDRATTAIVNGGTWQLCADANYMSTCEVFGPGRYDNLAAVTGRVSSARPLPGGGNQGGGGQGGGGWGGGGQGGGGWGGGWGGNTRVVIYEGPNFSGRSYTVNTDFLGNLDGTGFNDRASSLRVERGYWMFCTDANLQGDCRTFAPGDYASLSWFSNRISSGRRIANDYPYNAPPQWRN